MRGLIIKTPFIDQILSGLKTWEIRGSSCRIREKIALIRSQSGLIFGTAFIDGSVGPLSKEDMKKNMSRHRCSLQEIESGSRYKNVYAWIIKDVKRWRVPKKYQHPSGAVIWVTLRNLDLDRS